MSTIYREHEPDSTWIISTGSHLNWIPVIISNEHWDPDGAWVGIKMMKLLPECVVCGAPPAQRREYKCGQKLGTWTEARTGTHRTVHSLSLLISFYFFFETEVHIPITSACRYLKSFSLGSPIDIVFVILHNGG